MRAAAPLHRNRRATALPPDARRAAIVAATLPLVLEHGAGVSTRMIAAAAGIAEGTIFRAFPDKDSLLDAVVEKAFDPAPTEQALAGIDPTLAFEQQLSKAVEILQRRLTDIWRLASTVGADTVHVHRRAPSDLAALVALFEPERAAITREPVLAARMLRGLTLAFSHPTLAPDGPMTPDEIVALLLDGIRAHPASCRHDAGRTPARTPARTPGREGR